MANSEKRLNAAVENNRASEVSSLLRAHPEINVNWMDEDEWAAIHYASSNGHDGVVKVLLAHPDINVNLKNKNGQTSISLGCQFGYVSVVQLLLKDSRVDVILVDNQERTPLWYAVRNGHHEVIEWLIASGRDLGDIHNTKGKWFSRGEHSALEVARNRERTEVVSLLEKFMANPRQARHEVRAKLGFADELAAEIFALMVFLCDDLLQLKPAALASNPATRFFAIASKVPMELQMILCHRVVGSTQQNIRHTESEAAFQSLATIFLKPTSTSTSTPTPAPTHLASRQSNSSCSIC